MKNNILLLLLLSSIISIKAQNNWKSFTNLNYVNGIAFDQQGNKWFASKSGLIKYNNNNYTIYTAADGLCANTVNAVVVDNQNNIWAATNNGISKFNGNSWTTYNTSNGLSNNLVYSIYIDNNGLLWFGTNSGVSKYDGTSWTTYKSGEGNLFGWDLSGVAATSKDKNNNYWFSGNIASKFDGTTWKHYSSNNSGLRSWGDLKAMVSDSSGNTWFGTRNGLCKIQDTVWSSIDPNTFGCHIVSSILKTKSENIWVGYSSNGNDNLGGNGGISVFDGSNWINYTTSQGLPSNKINAIAENAIGEVWIATSNGVSVYNGNSFQNINFNNEAIGDYLWKIVVDSNNYKWFISKNGLTKLKDNQFTKYISPQNIILPACNAIAVDKQNVIWAAYENGIASFDGVNWTSFNSQFQFTPWSLTIDEAGNKWISTAYWGNNPGTYKFDGSTWTQMNTSNGLSSNQVTTVKFDKDGNQWFGTMNGLNKLSGNVWTKYFISDGLSDNGIYDIEFDNQNNVWVGTNNGLCKFDGTSWQQFNKAMGGNAFTCKDISIDSDNNIWIATNFSGAAKYDGNTFTYYNLNNSSISNLSLESATIDLTGNIFFSNSTNGCISYLEQTIIDTNQYITINDSILKTAILSHSPIIDTDNNKQISLTEAQSVDSLILDGKNIKNIDELNLFPNLKSLNISNNSFTSLDVSFLNINKLNAQGNSQLTSVCVSATQFPQTNSWIKDAQTVWDTNCGVKNIYFPDTAFKNELSRWTIYNNNHQVITLDENNDHEISYREALEVGQIWLGNGDGFMQNTFKQIDITGIEHFENLILLAFMSYDIRGLEKLKQLNQLRNLNLLGNKFDSLDLAHHPSISLLSLASSKVKYVNFSGMEELLSLQVAFNEINKLDISSLPKIHEIYCNNNNNLTSICVAPWQIDSVAWTKDSTTTFSVYCGSNIIDIKDTNLLNALLAHAPKIDLNNDNKISYDEALNVSVLDISNSGILNLINISAFTNLISLNVSGNALTQLDISSLQHLQELIASNNYLSAIIFLKNLQNKKEDISSIDENNTLLTVDLSNNNLTHLDVSQLTVLTNLNVSNNSQLGSVCVNQNQLNNEVNTWAKDANTSWSNQSCALSNSMSIANNRHFIPAYPNPTKNLVYVAEKAQGIYSVSGVLIRANTNGYIIDVSNVASGFYYIQYESGKIEKLVIQH